MKTYKIWYYIEELENEECNDVGGPETTGTCYDTQGEAVEALVRSMAAEAA